MQGYLGSCPIKIYTKPASAKTEITIPTRRSNQNRGLYFHFLISERMLKNIAILTPTIDNKTITVQSVIL